MIRALLGMRRITISLVILSSLLFVGSGLIDAIQRWNVEEATTVLDALGAADSALLMRDGSISFASGPMAELWQPADPFQAALLVVIWAAALIYALRFSGAIQRFGPSRDAVARPVATTEALGVSIGLVAAAMAPWALRHSSFWGFGLAAISFAAILFAALNRRFAGSSPGSSMSLGVLAAGATLLLCSAFAAMVEQGLPVSSTIATLLAILSCAFIATKVQLSLGSPIAYSVTIIWALLGLLVATINVNPMVATAAVLAIAFVGVALVRVAS